MESKLSNTKYTCVPGYLEFKESKPHCYTRDLGNNNNLAPFSDKESCENYCEGHYLWGDKLIELLEDLNINNVSNLDHLPQAGIRLLSDFVEYIMYLIINDFNKFVKMLTSGLLNNYSKFLVDEILYRYYLSPQLAELIASHWNITDLQKEYIFLQLLEQSEQSTLLWLIDKGYFKPLVNPQVLTQLQNYPNTLISYGKDINKVLELIVNQDNVGDYFNILFTQIAGLAEEDAYVDVNNDIEIDLEFLDGFGQVFSNYLDPSESKFIIVLKSELDTYLQLCQLLKKYLQDDLNYPKYSKESFDFLRMLLTHISQKARQIMNDNPNLESKLVHQALSFTQQQHGSNDINDDNNNDDDDNDDNNDDNASQASDDDGYDDEDNYQYDEDDEDNENN